MDCESRRLNVSLSVCRRIRRESLSYEGTTGRSRRDAGDRAVTAASGTGRQDRSTLSALAGSEPVRAPPASAAVRGAAADCEVSGKPPGASGQLKMSTRSSADIASARFSLWDDGDVRTRLTRVQVSGSRTSGDGDGITEWRTGSTTFLSPQPASSCSTWHSSCISSLHRGAR